MLRKLKAMTTLAGTLGAAASSGRLRARRDQAAMDLIQLDEQERLLEEHFKRRYSTEQYRNSKARIEADRRRLQAKFDMWQAKLDQLEAKWERKALEVESELQDDTVLRCPSCYKQLRLSGAAGAGTVRVVCPRCGARLSTSV